MKLSYLKAKDFRNIRETTLVFGEGVNVLCGENGQGKTNALECLYLFSRGRSFRAGGEAEMVRFGAGGFSAEIGFVTGGRDHTLVWRYFDGRHKRIHNGFEVEKIGEFIGLFRAVLFSPDHLRLVKGSPDARREFLNVAVSQIDHEYTALYVRFRHILDNRNTLLRFAQKNLYVDPAELTAWTEQLADVSARLAVKRKAYVDELGRFAPVFLREISGGRDELSVSYDGCVGGEDEDSIRDAYLAAFEAERPREAAAGYSLFGVHRDDLRLTINGADARTFASQGQQRSVVLALKTAEGEVCKKICGEYPVFLFDDVLSELDERRRAYVTENIKDKQIIVTSCDREIDGDARTILVRDGVYCPAE